MNYGHFVRRVAGLQYLRPAGVLMMSRSSFKLVSLLLLLLSQPVFAQSPTVLPWGTVGVYYTQQIGTIPANSPPSVSAGALPPGLLFSGTTSGASSIMVVYLSGTPTTPGTYSFSLRFGGTFRIVIVSAASAAPIVESVTPSSGYGAAQTFAVTVFDAASEISQVYVIINDTLNGAPACYVTYAAASNTFWLMNDDGSAWQGPASVRLSSSVSA